MMKLLVIVAMFGMAVAQQGRPSPRVAAGGRPAYPTRTEDIVNLRSEFENPGDGTYSYAYENSDGTSVSQKGYQKAPLPGGEFPINVAEGFYRFYSPEGEETNIQYTADENGYQAQGDNLPTPPPIPEAIQRSIAINLAAAAQQTQAQPQRRF